MKVLLIQPRSTYHKDLPLVIQMPLGLCYLAAVLREKGHKVGILDCLAEGYTNKTVIGDMITYGLSDADIIRKIEEFKPDVIGCSSLFSLQYDNTKYLCRLIKKINPKIITVAGGMHVTVRPYEVLSDKNTDFILQGESEYTFSQLIDALEDNKDYSDIDGIGYKGKDCICVKRKEKFIENLDELPFPARDLLNINAYFKAGLAHGFALTSKRNVNLITSRGCPGGCVFCTINLIAGKRFRARSPENVLAELEQVKKDFGVRHVQFEDDNLTFNIERAKKIFQGMIDRRLNLKWNPPSAVALWRMDKETLDLMKKSGCYYVKFAVESGSQRVLNEVIKKPQDLNRAIPLIKYARKIGMRVGSFFVVGLPGETKEEIKESFEFPYKVRLDWVEYSLATPHYGTELRKICEENKYLRDHDMSDLYCRKGVIDTPEFTADWLEKTVIAENKRYIIYLLFHQPMTFLMHGFDIFRRNPFFVIQYMLKIFSAPKRKPVLKSAHLLSS